MNNFTSKKRIFLSNKFNFVKIFWFNWKDWEGESSEGDKEWDGVLIFEEIGSLWLLAVSEQFHS